MIFSNWRKKNENRHFTVAGRIKLFRLMGKASFKIEDEKWNASSLCGKRQFTRRFYNDIFKKNIEVGDIVEVTGYPFITGQGELSLHADDLKIFNKSNFSTTRKNITVFKIKS